MQARGIAAKAVIEGPPPRAVPILLRQTSFKAIEEGVTFPGDRPGHHTARFGEIEQRGAALTAKGRALYDQLLATARASRDRRATAMPSGWPSPSPPFPTRRRLCANRAGLVPLRPDRGRAAAGRDRRAAGGRYRCVAGGGLCPRPPIVYEDFLPVSAAGIFQSNLGGTEQRSYAASAAQAAFEEALGDKVQDELALYAEARHGRCSRCATPCAGVAAA